MWIGTASTRAFWCVTPRPTCLWFHVLTFSIQWENVSCHLYDDNVFREYTWMNDCVYHFMKIHRLYRLSHLMKPSCVFHSIWQESNWISFVQPSMPCRSCKSSRSKIAMKFVLAISKHCQRPLCDFFIASCLAWYTVEWYVSTLTLMQCTSYECFISLCWLNWSCV